jgi:hypothetical protein
MEHILHKASISVVDFTAIFGQKLHVEREFGVGTRLKNLHVMKFFEAAENGMQKTAVMQFDPEEGSVYSVSVQSYSPSESKTVHAYRFLNPEHRGEDCFDVNTNEVSLEMPEDWIEKATAIRHGEAFDSRVLLQLDLPEETMHQLMLLAHQQDLTLNQLVAKIMKEHIEKLEKETNGKTWTVQIVDGPDGELFLPIPEELLTSKGWKVGDELAWTVGDGWVELSAKPKDGA